MPVTRDTTCDLIERPAMPVRQPDADLLGLPHAELVADRLTNASAASRVLLGLGGLIQRIVADTAGGVTIRLHRAPPRGAFGRGTTHTTVDRYGHIETVERLYWRGVHIEWETWA